MCFKQSLTFWAGLGAAVFLLCCLAMSQAIRRQSGGSRLKVMALGVGAHGRLMSM